MVLQFRSVVHLVVAIFNRPSSRGTVVSVIEWLDMETDSGQLGDGVSIRLAQFTVLRVLHVTAAKAPLLSLITHRLVG